MISKQLPWKLKLLRDAALKPLVATSEWFQVYLATFGEVYRDWQKGNKNTSQEARRINE